MPSRIVPVSVLSERALLHPEAIHGEEGLRILGFEDVPSIEIEHRGIVGESRRVAALVLGTDQKSEKLQVVLGQEGFDRRQRQPMLLDMKHQVTTVACREEVEPACD